MVLRPACGPCPAGVSGQREVGERYILFFYNKVFREEAVARRARPEPLDDAAPGHGAARMDGAGRTRRVVARAPRLGDARERGAPPVGRGGAGPAGRAPCRGLPRVRQRRREAGRRRGHPRSGAGDSPGSACRRRSARPGSRGGSRAPPRTGCGAPKAPPPPHSRKGCSRRRGTHSQRSRSLPGNRSSLRMEGSSWRTVWFRASRCAPERRSPRSGAGPKTLGRRWPSYRRRTPGSSQRGMAAEVLVALPGPAGFEHAGRPGAGSFPTARRRSRMACRLRPFDTRPFAPASSGAGRSVAPAARRRCGRARADRVGEAVPRGSAAGGRGRLTPAAVSIDVRRATRSSVLPLPLGTERVFPEPRQGTDRTAGAAKP